MVTKSKKIIVNFPGGWNISSQENDNIDFNLICDKKVYFGIFYTLKNISALMEKPEFNQHFWCSGMIILKNLTKREIIRSVIKLYESAEYDDVLTYIGEDEQIFATGYGEILEINLPLVNSHSSDSFPSPYE